ncbi:hypothetical protein GCM10011399_35520 [Subtercola lobariae]|uniref:Uncharacterized protein n=2 Tax=Subtercola lobariae TaxID=1588641 RepID=A0A917BH17_9MICO|nr:hypothetical protein GCM10011399_35520 [Subtercola lobariae]
MHEINEGYSARRVLYGLIALGLLVSALSIVAVVWQSAAAQTVTFTCGDLGCQASDPALYFLTTAALLFAPTLLAAGAASAVISFAMTRLLISTRLDLKPTNSKRMRRRWRSLPELVVWAPGIILTAISAISMLYISQASMSPGSLCEGASCSGEYALTQFLHSFAPAGLLIGIVCLLVAALRRALPHPDAALGAPQVELTLVKATDPKAFMRPTDNANSGQDDRS